MFVIRIRVAMRLWHICKVSVTGCLLFHDYPVQREVPFWHSITGAKFILKELILEQLTLEIILSKFTFRF